MLDYIFYPESVALVGASNSEGKIGYFYMKNLVDDFRGKIFPVNPNEETVQGLKSYKSIKEIPDAVDLAVIVVPTKAVLEVIEDCAHKGVKAALVTTSGFGEVGKEGKELENRMLEIARKGRVKIIGPNSFGLRNCNVGLNATFAFEGAKEGGDISFLTQSGGGGEAIYVQAKDTGLRFAKFIVCGNKSDLEDYEVVEYFGDDKETKVICLFLEAIKEGKRFFEETKKVALKKPVVVSKIGRTEGAARAASSHTAALAGDFKAYETAFRQSGAIYARNTLELMDIVKGLDWQPLPKGNRVGIITASGGFGVELTDLCEEHGLKIPELSEKTQAKIRPHIPSYASAKNPVDMTPVWAQFEKIMEVTIEEFYKSREIDIIVPIIVLRATRMKEVLESVRDVILKCQKEIKKPTYICWISLKDSLRNKEIFEDAKIPCFEWTERVANAASAIYGYSKFLQKRGVDIKNM
ncbi:MAG: hypothetical protein A3C43_04020 [Candidatus Schekmanbacteria bacterium RIFCSPHIGHO2_02_FULL_38_11]|uniref:CoA-binding domain-containing protein n=1 Tax=Candidatus Schekmanbacteria bacterium RIFCSPLOWO2_12_FULL_38_15 TaxID=1817883 RepID=A0A1F7SH92_9BACT|nr:MAG: hypothetical protein A2043_04365 [Candidatus Schekmanbacteria bacterium GWA2_38_9]OGL49760.1 MAG: hypothetical protein A3H37_01715 [Candidatus Schekmanbacteria bacterium RIFCSPLOWO2_02_FULL_38_14]OGL53115.1 MAG: hypothetical protein A3G31_09270 [Candidatus Schekmanbacteria bacterium RIFCSPLOWO2_12_FULL_38_15]OGL53800.1 MAG: hypothetical protein A3C43_04020 [Candidatus Schekmanbacteria bacterium RIFCSPHIGHO2_02_FULL_38_11]